MRFIVKYRPISEWDGTVPFSSFMDEAVIVDSYYSSSPLGKFTDIEGFVNLDVDNNTNDFFETHFVNSIEEIETIISESKSIKGTKLCFRGHTQEYKFRRSGLILVAIQLLIYYGNYFFFMVMNLRE